MKEIIILDQQPRDGGISQLNVLFWFPVTPSREIAVPGGASRYRDVTDVENGAIAAGSVVEEYFSHIIPVGTTAAQVKAQLQAIYANRKAAFDARPNPNQFYGTSWDGTVWA